MCFFSLERERLETCESAFDRNETDSAQRSAEKEIYSCATVPCTPEETMTPNRRTPFGSKHIEHIDRGVCECVV